MTLDFVDEIYTCIVIILWKRGMISVRVSSVCVVKEMAVLERYCGSV